MKEWLEALRDVATFAWYFAGGILRQLARRLRRMVNRIVVRSDRPRPVPPPTPAEHRRNLLLRRILPWAVAAAVLWSFAAVAGSRLGTKLLEDPPPAIETLRKSDGPQFALSSFVRDAQGDVIYTFSEEKREYVRYAEISPHVINALVAVEDEQFWKHHGINVQGVARAALSDAKASIKARRLVFPQGGSSITQQLAKQIWVGNDRNFERKLKEALYALHVEQSFSKEEILELYLNKVYLGHQRYGVESASQFYFGKSAKDLTLAEGALIAGLPQAPSNLSPRSNPEGALKRRNHVLDRMVIAGFIKKDEAEAAKATPITLMSSEAAGTAYTQQTAPFFVEEVRRQLLADPDLADQVMTGGLEIETTLDMDLQRKATRAVREGLRKLDKELSRFRPITRNVLADGPPEAYDDPLWLLPPEYDDVLPGVVLDVADGRARVRIGSSVVNAESSAIAWTGRRRVEDVLHRGDVAPFRVEQRDAAGAITKVKLEQDPEIDGALVAIEVGSGEIVAMVGGYDYDASEFNKATQAKRQLGSGFKPLYYATALERGLRPSTTILDEPTVFVDPWNGSEYKPENYYEKYYGRVTMREALERSLNIASVRLLNYVGYDHAIQTARRCGVEAELNPYPSLALGAQEMTLLESTSAFSVFPNMGLRVKPSVLRRIKSAKGEVLAEHAPEVSEAMSPQVAFQMIQLMRGVVQDGTATAARSLGRQVAGKTGTTDDYSNAWFIGFSPSLVVGVWVGYSRETKSIGEGYAGAKAALPIWIDFMRQYFDGRPEETFTNPGGVEFVAIDKKTGLVASPECPPDDVILESFQEGNRPFEACSASHHRALWLPGCLQRFGMDADGFLLVPDENALADLERDPTACPVTIDRMGRVISHGWAAAGVPNQYAYRIGGSGAVERQPDSLEALMAINPHSTRDGSLHDFDVVDGRTVVIVRNDR